MKLTKKDFIYDFLLSYWHRSQSVARVRLGEQNLALNKENSIFGSASFILKSQNNKTYTVL
ncbi:hypothetical protein AMD27_15110 [Acinetobacter sp. TGL-Y2]|nr:hypothetical protein AMD27_15110 [Acinetobacter sp. TGL-Y2]